MHVFPAVQQIILSAQGSSAVEAIIALVFGIGFFAIIITKLISKRLYIERMEGVWYCKALNMQISFTDPYDSFWMENEEKIRCRCDAGYSKFHKTTIDLLCNEWDHPKYANGKTLFLGDLLKQDEKSMLVFDYKSLLEYTFERTDKIE